jgi:hypothetical protein
MKEQVGPTHVTRHWDSCLGCKFHLARMVKSGRCPEYEHFCQHEKAKTVGVPSIEVPGKGIFIGDTDDTPLWCPEKRSS